MSSRTLSRIIRSGHTIARRDSLVGHSASSFALSDDLESAAALAKKNDSESAAVLAKENDLESDEAQTAAGYTYDTVIGQ